MGAVPSVRTCGASNMSLERVDRRRGRGQAKVPHALRRILLDALAARDEGLAGDALADRIAGLQARIDRFCARTPTHDPNRRLVGHVARERDHLLTFLTHEGVAATNWRAEQALRGMVCNRKQWGGNKTRAGADTAAVVASVLRTADQQRVDPVEVLADIQRTRGIPDRLGLATVDGGGGAEGGGRRDPTHPAPPRRPLPRHRHRNHRRRRYAEVVFDHTGDAYVVGVATMTGTRIDAPVDHDGDQFLRERLTVYITNAVLEP